MSIKIFPPSPFSETQGKKQPTSLQSLQLSNNIDLTKVRILQKTIVYIIGLSETLANQEILSRYECLGQYGTILKVVVNKSGYNQNFQKDTTYSAYVTFSSQEEASLALLVVDNSIIDGHIIRCSFGTTKYCTFFLKGVACINKDCLYFHKWANEEDIIIKDDIMNNKQIFHTQQKIALKIADVFNKEKKKQIIGKGKNRRLGLFPNDIHLQFPYVESIYNKDNLYKLAREIKGSCAYKSAKQEINEKLNAVCYSKKNNNSINNKDQEEMEYILVNGISKKQKRFREERDNSNSYNNSKIKNKCLFDEYEQINSSFMTNEIGDIDKTFSSKSTFDSPEKVIKKYKTKVRSRYDFVDQTKQGGVFVPDYISEIININLSKFTRTSSRENLSECSSSYGSIC